MTPLVSVITIFFDCERFIQEAIDSVLAQSYGSWELLLVDDGSKDGSTQIAQRYASRFPEKIRYLEHPHHENRGMSASRNLGIQRARGEYLAFLDADDVWLPRKLERQVAILNAQPSAAMVYGPTHEWYGWTGKPEDSRRDFVQKLGLEPNSLVQPPTLARLALENEDRSPRTCSVLVRRTAANDIGGFEDHFRGLYEDQAFFTKLCLRYPVFASGDTGDRYRHHKNGSCVVAVETGDYHSARQKYIDWVADYVASQGIKDGALSEVIEKERWPYLHPRQHAVVQHVRDWMQFIRSAPARGASALLPSRTRRWVRAKWTGRQYQPPVGGVRYGDLRRITPISSNFGFERGLPVDRFYIEHFLAAHAADIHGRVLEIGDNQCTRQFGGDRVTKSDVLHVHDGNLSATIVADLTCAEHIPSDNFNCVICVQTLQFIYDVRAAVRTLYRILKPGGALLATVPGISQLGHDEWRNSWCWSFTTTSVRRLFAEAFGDKHTEVVAHGNVLAATAFLQGIATEELRCDELDHQDPDYEMLITVRALKLPAQ